MEEIVKASESADVHPLRQRERSCEECDDSGRSFMAFRDTYAVLLAFPRIINGSVNMGRAVNQYLSSPNSTLAHAL